MTPQWICSFAEIEALVGEHLGQTYGRWSVHIRLRNGKYTVMSKARYTWLKEIGDIPEGLEVDHIDNDKTNDAIENLQLLTRRQNMRKLLDSKGYVDVMYLSCSECGDEVIRPIGRHNRQIKTSDRFFCSKACRNKYHGKYNGDFVSVLCGNCDKEIVEMKCKIADRINRSKSGHLFCSHKCASQAARKFGWK